MGEYQPIIRIIEEEYEIPQLGRTRRISALLPHDYEETNKQYSVLYLHDGQNLFNEDAPYGNWAIDQSLGRLAEQGFKDLIIIAIDHGGEDRVTEYSPYYNPKFGEGQGGLYMEFFMEKLVPYVHKKFRVFTDRMHTGIGGSSMGGLISLFAGVHYPEVFGKMMIFSPSLWISPKLWYHTSNFFPKELTSLYIYAGGKESKNHLSNVERLRTSFLRSNVDHSLWNMEISINPEGTHSESHWREEFPTAIQWLFPQNV